MRSEFKSAERHNNITYSFQSCKPHLGEVDTLGKEGRDITIAYNTYILAACEGLQTGEIRPAYMYRHGS